MCGFFSSVKCREKTLLTLSCHTSVRIIITHTHTKKKPFHSPHKLYQQHEIDVKGCIRHPLLEYLFTPKQHPAPILSLVNHCFFESLEFSFSLFESSTLLPWRFQYTQAANYIMDLTAVIANQNIHIKCWEPLFPIKKSLYSKSILCVKYTHILLHSYFLRIDTYKTKTARFHQILSVKYIWKSENWSLEEN